jgi:uncharacterized protein YjdB
MNRHLRASTLGAVMVLVAIAARALPAHAVAVSTGTGSGLAGQTVDIDINTASLTGLNVVSFAFTLSYSSNVVTAVNVITTGSMTAAAGWAAPEFHVNSSGGTGTIQVADAGSTPLSGSGSLLKVRFTINPALLNGSSTGLTLSSFTFNEGTPVATMTGSTLTVNPTPQIDVTPDVGEIIRGQTLQFAVTGTPTLPITWTTSSGAIATISSAGLLTGVAPGLVTVTATDAALHASTTTSQVAVRGMGLTAGTSTVVVGQTVTLPITVTSLAGLGIRSGQFALSFYGPLLVATAVTTPPGTLLNGWGAVTFAGGYGTASVAFAGSTDLTGSGVLCYVTFATLTSGGTGIAVSSAMFNETLPALKISGSVSVSPLPVIYVNPDIQSLLAGQTQQYVLSGSPTNPITWSVEDPSIASIDGTGLVTALQGGVTRVRAQDAVGAVDFSTSLSVYDFKATLGSVTGPPGGTVKVYLTSDRLVGGLGIHSMQFDVSWYSGYSAYITDARTTPSGLWSTWGSGGIQSHRSPNTITVASGGSAIFANTGPELGSLQFDIAPGTPLGTDIALTVGHLVFNEGHPVAQVEGGVLRVRATAGLDAPGVAFALGRSEPNPAHGEVRIPFALPAGAEGGGPVRLAIYGLDGRRVRSLIEASLAPGPHTARWDGRDDAGTPVPTGLYFTRLEWRGQSASRKVALVN